MPILPNRGSCWISSPNLPLVLNLRRLTKMDHFLQSVDVSPSGISISDSAMTSEQLFQFWLGPANPGAFDVCLRVNPRRFGRD